MMGRMKGLLLPLTASLVATGLAQTAALGQDPDQAARLRYQLEILVFRNLGYVPRASSAQDTLHFPLSEPGPQVEFLLLNPLTGEDSPRLIAPEFLEMEAEWKRLERSSAYEPLSLTGWSQPAWDKRAAPP